MRFSLLLISLLFMLPCKAQMEDYKNTSLNFDQRTEDLLRRLTLEEKVALMQDASKAVPRLDIKTYNWWNEALHGVARAGLATVFPQAIGMAATFDDGEVYRVFSAVSDEARAKHTHFAARGEYGRYQGLTMWTPNINIFRDPRWGRGMETYGEDPYLTTRMGVAVVKGLQGNESAKYDKLHACAKHFAVHSGPEWNRHSYNAENIVPRDLHETYLPAFEALVKEAKVKEVMCAYNRYEGEPCCGSNRLLTQILRDQWKFDGIVVSDCGAIADFYNDRGHKTHPDAASASAVAVLSGTDLECGASYKALLEAVQKGYISEQAIDVSVRRLLKARFELGEMDKDVEWAKIPYEVVASSKHDSLALDVARKSMTLLLNKNGLLPLKKSGGMTIAVMGPNANDAEMQWGNYNGTPLRTITILDGIRAALSPADKLIYEQGCGLVERTLLKSVFNQCAYEGKTGFAARYWNNLERKGAPAADVHHATPFRFCTSGATVFAPGVNLTDFSATYSSVFTPTQSGAVVLDLYVCGAGRLLVNGVEVKKFATKHGGRNLSHEMKVESGKSYDIAVEFEYLNGDAMLNFDLGFKENVDINRSVAAVKDADVVVFVGGISPKLEGEEMGVSLPGFKRGDRTDIELPAVQRELLEALHRAGKKVILVSCSGSPIGLTSEVKTCEAILQAWYPGQAGGTAVAEVLFGKYNPAGRLPITFYRDTTQLPDFESYDMAGRTYRYLNTEPLFHFGYGLSYTTFSYEKIKLSAAAIKRGESLSLTIPVVNKGKMGGDEVVQVYLRKRGDVMNKTLRAYKRVYIPVGAREQVLIHLSQKQLEWWSEKTQQMEACEGEYDLLVGSSSRTEDLQVVQLRIE